MLAKRASRFGRASPRSRWCSTSLGIQPNPARDRVQVRLSRQEAQEPEPPSADHVEAVGWLLPAAYLLGLLTLDATGVRIGELEAAKVGDLDEERKAWLVRAAVSKTRRARWVRLPDDLFEAVVGRLPAREDRDPSAPLFSGVTADRLRMAIQRACRDAGVPHFSPHALRHRRISLMHRQGSSWRNWRGGGAAIEDRDRGSVHARSCRLPGGQSSRAARTCSSGAHPRAHLARRKCRICGGVLGQYHP